MKKEIPKLKKVVSSNLAAIGYEDGSLFIQFKNKLDVLYKYKKVPRGTYTRLLAAQSVGIFFQSYILHKYQFDRVPV